MYPARERNYFGDRFVDRDAIACDLQEKIAVKINSPKTAYSILFSHTTRTNLLLCPHLYWSLPPRALRTERPSRCASFSVVVSTFQFLFASCKRIILSSGFFSRARSSSFRRILTISLLSPVSIPSNC